jgi:glutamate N-acetyltransferase/amino-acid N-acetyltransferase
MKLYKSAFLPQGFKANGVACGIKKSGKLDLALLYAEQPAKAAFRFSANTIQAAPIIIDKKYLKAKQVFRGVLINSGNANCFTSDQGLKDAEAMSLAVSRALGLAKGNILVASTGIIGRRLPVDKIKKAVPGLISGLSRQAIVKAKRAILTTDTVTKEFTSRIKIGGCKVTLCGIAKGSGMIAPKLGTMLAFILTDANITQRALDRALDISLNKSFNCITVDGCMSTNDTVGILANGAAGNYSIDINSNFGPFLKALEIVCLELAKSIVRDAEGATKFICISVEKARSSCEAKRIAMFIANSNLFKTAMFGENPNFGRIVAAAGASRAGVDEKNLKIKVSPLNKKEIIVEVDVNRGKYSAQVYTSDLTPQYIKINAQYN